METIDLIRMKRSKGIEKVLELPASLLLGRLGVGGCLVSEGVYLLCFCDIHFLG